MKKFKFFEFNGVEVIAFKCQDDEDMDAIKYIAISELGNIEMTPSFEAESTRDEAWDKSCEGIAKSLAIMCSEAFVAGDNYE